MMNVPQLHRKMVFWACLPRPTWIVRRFPSVQVLNKWKENWYCNCHSLNTHHQCYSIVQLLPYSVVRDWSVECEWNHKAYYCIYKLNGICSPLAITKLYPPMWRTCNVYFFWFYSHSRSHSNSNRWNFQYILEGCCQQRPPHKQSYTLHNDSGILFIFVLVVCDPIERTKHHIIDMRVQRP